MSTEKKAETSLHCIIEEKFFYFGIINSDQQFVSSDCLEMDNGSDFFKNPYLLVAYIKESLSAFQITQLNIGIINQDFALLPQGVNRSSAAAWISSKPSVDSELYIDELDHVNVAYYAPQALVSVLKKTYESYTLHHIVSINVKNNDGKSGVFSYKINGFQLIQVNNDQGRLEYSNIFKSRSVNSRLYYSLLPYHMHDLDRERATLYVNDHNEGSVLQDKLSQYVRNIEHVEKGITLSQDTKLTEDQIYQLSNLASCVS